MISPNQVIFGPDPGLESALTHLDPDLALTRWAEMEPAQKKALWGDPSAQDPLDVFARLGEYNQFSRLVRPVRAGKGKELLFRELCQVKPEMVTKAYVHLPFCKSRCLYCGFYMARPEPGLVDNYLDLLLKELSDKRSMLAGLSFDALYLGGGTPSDLNPSQMKRLFKGIVSSLNLKPGAEITLEGRLKGFGPDRLETALELGVNRFSFGVQSFDTDLRRFLGRRLDRNRIKQKLAQIKTRSAKPVCIDLIAGLPGQSMELWQRDLTEFAELGLDGLSLYPLRLSGRTPLDMALRGGLAPPVPEARGQAELCLWAGDFLNTLGWRRLDLVHWKKGEQERCLYEKRQREKGRIFGFGWGANSDLGKLRQVNHIAPGSYRALVEKGVQPVMVWLEQPGHYRLINRVADQLNHGFLNPAGLGIKSRSAQSKISALIESVTGPWLSQGLLQKTPQGLALSKPGWFFAPNLIQGLFDLLDLARPAQRPQRPVAPPRHFSLFMAQRAPLDCNQKEKPGHV
ncbi:radical SAM protein [Dethiosulfatarculus sandiegensis]|uniref:Radical SAM core domain-containing protein n=1 Tax=Dethiosulfatarculus sandiegensis TaxID=1429043 RepID=A0A0D2GHF5_9BACT|nr:radical SAM protein [Dethiosulfatarculus sandiegensis]KIX14342.1 hypothetical protein X474_08770 [Dethiosulfatarculus sandiegensis]